MSNISHIVQPGETLGRIAKKFGVRVQDIMALNPTIEDEDLIFAGQEILIPTGAPNSEQPTQPTQPTPPSTAGSPLNGLDASERITSIATCIKDKGFAFAIRYYNIENSDLLPTKRLILSEAQALVRAGLQLGAIFQQNGRVISSFSREKGLRDGAMAHSRAVNDIGQPAGSTIYFGVDFDASPSEVGNEITDYFKAVSEALANANGGSPRYAIGVYGSGLVCSEMLAANLLTFTWLSQSTGHAGSKEFAEQKRYNLIQFLDRDVCGVNLDPDETNPDKPSGFFTIPV